MSTTPSIQQQLRQPFDRAAWQEMLHGLFPDGTVSLFASPQTLAASQENIAATRQLGTVELGDGNAIALLEVETTDQVKLARNRVGLRNFVANFIDEAGAAAVLAVFHQAGSPDWRLTYASRQTTLDEDTFEITTIETAPRRFTFLLGENEPCRTAAARLAGIQDKGDALALPDVEKAFSVETLTKDFFKKYKEHYLHFVSHLLSPAEAETTRESFGVPMHDDEKDQEKADKPIRDFVKTLLGRLVFLHFLQKKGWLGCKAGGRKWKGGDADFLQSFLRSATDEGESAYFHSKYLCPLFFEALNTPERPGDLFPLTGTRLPYLNGGLFEEDGDEQRGLDFPVEHFHGLLDFFGEYNFTIDENDPEDHEVGIDPEMLGHIFENLLEDNKDKGAFYTPKAIVSYMARQSLLHYLQTHLGENAELEKLLNEKDLSNHPDGSFVDTHKTRIGELLDEVKICDPAIGSGAFPIGLLQEILWTRLALQPELNTPAERARLKRRIIQHSIHGVDIDPGAIEIARLRFWLALVVDEDEPRPLPNLDYKIHRADSLIEYIRGEPVNLGTEPPKDCAAREAVEKLIAAKQSLFTAQKLPDKRAAWFDLYRALAQLAQAEFTWMRNDTDFTDGERMALLNRGIHEFGQWIGKIDSIRREKVHHQETLLGQLRAWFDDMEKPTFLWNLHFGEIFAKGGFDVVIANPPYLVVSKELFSGKIREILFATYKAAEYKADLYALFTELGVRLLRKNGVLAYITPNPWLTQKYFKKLRELLLVQSAILEVATIDSKVFESATVDNCVLQVRRGAPKSSHKVSLKQPNHLVGLFDQELGFGRQREWSVDPSKCFQTRMVGPVGDLVKRLCEDFEKLGDSHEVAIGCQAYNGTKHTKEQMASRVFHSEKRESSEWLPEIGGKQVTRFGVKIDPKKWIRHGPWLHDRRGDEWLAGPRVLVREVTGKAPHRIFAAFESRELCFYKTVLGIFPKVRTSEDCLSTVAILNSLVISFLFPFVANKLVTKTFPRVSVADLKKLPFPSVNSAAPDKARLAELAEACAEAAKKDDRSSLAVLEVEINQIVYRLFDLTPEEIALIESSLAT